MRDGPKGQAESTHGDDAHAGGFHCQLYHDACLLEKSIPLLYGRGGRLWWFVVAVAGDFLVIDCVRHPRLENSIFN